MCDWLRSTNVESIIFLFTDLGTPGGGGVRPIVTVGGGKDAKKPKKKKKKLWSRTSTALKNTRSPFSLSLSSHFQAFMVSGEYVVAKEEREESVCEWVKEREKWLQDSLGTTNESSGTIPYINFLYLVSFCTYTAPLDANVNTVNKVLSNMYKMVVN